MNVEGMAGLQRRLRAIADTEGLLVDWQLGAVEEAKTRAERFKRTGNLQRNIVPGISSRTSALVHARAGYSAYVERGTGIYGPRRQKIVPKTKRFLAWQANGRMTGRGGSWVYARSVRGRPATPYLVPGAQAAAKKLGVDAIIKSWNEAD